MVRARFILALLFVVCFSFATCLQPRQAIGDAGDQSATVLVALLGDGRKMFANEVFAKADAYFHRGKYPSIFEVNARKGENHMTGEAAGEDEHAGEDHDHDHHDEGPPPARDWIERFGRHFYPTEHVELSGGEEREMLPWLRLSAELDPHQTETYTVAAYWLRNRLGKVDEAELFLREGLRQNPNSPDLLNELAKLNFQNRTNLNRAKNLWQVALRRWHEVEDGKKEPDQQLLREIVSGLAEIEIQHGQFSRAIEYFRQLKEVSPHPDEVQKRIDELAARPQATP